MTADLQSKLDHCYALAKNGATELAQTGLRSAVKQFCSCLRTSSAGDTECILEGIERTAHRTGIRVGLHYAEHFYQVGKRSAARGWLRHANIHAQHLHLDITDSISEIKREYKDWMPLLF